MSKVDQFTNTLNTYMWKNVEYASFNYPKLSKAIVFPVVTTVVLRDLLKNPAKLIEETILTSRSIWVYYNGPQDERAWHSIEHHTSRTFKAIIFTTISPLTTLIHSISTFVKVLFYTYKHAKVITTEFTFNAFIKENHFSTFITYSDDGLINFANEHKFANEIFNRFRNQVYYAKTNFEASKILLLNDQNAENEFNAEVALKKDIFEKANLLYMQKFKDAYLPNEKEKSFLLKILSKDWKNFQKDLIGATAEQAKGLKFEN